MCQCHTMRNDTISYQNIKVHRRSRFVFSKMTPWKELLLLVMCRCLRSANKISGVEYSFIQRSVGGRLVSNWVCPTSTGKVKICGDIFKKSNHSRDSVAPLFYEISWHIARQDCQAIPPPTKNIMQFIGHVLESAVDNLIFDNF